MKSIIGLVILFVAIGCGGGSTATREKNPTLDAQHTTKEQLEKQKKNREERYKELMKELEKK